MRGIIAEGRVEDKQQKTSNEQDLYSLLVGVSTARPANYRSCLAARARHDEQAAHED
jgi:hypothetical protein